MGFQDRLRKQIKIADDYLLPCQEGIIYFGEFDGFRPHVRGNYPATWTIVNNINH